MPDTKKPTHKVRNPRNTDSKIHIIRTWHAGKEFLWFEGDDFTRPPWFPANTVANYEARGFLELVQIDNAMDEGEP